MRKLPGVRGHIKREVGLLRKVSFPALVGSHGSSHVACPNGRSHIGSGCDSELKHLGVVMVSVSRMIVPSTVVKNSAISLRIFRKVATVDEVAV